MTRQRRTLVVTDDLLIVQQLQGPVPARRDSGTQLHAVGDEQQLIVQISGEAEVPTVVLDLRMVSIERLKSLVERLRAAAPNVAIVAFAPHVHTAKLQAAIDAGCDHVWTQGQLRSKWEQLYR